MNAMKQLKMFLIALLLLPAAAGSSLAAVVTVDVVAEQVSVTMPDGVPVPMWKLRRAADPAGTPLPVISATAGDTLTINLTNNLPADPVSLVLNGQVAPMVPTWTDDSTGNRTSVSQRVRSFTHEADPGGGGAIYTWPSLKAGTFLLQSGTHPGVQVPMGLYGAVKVDAAASQAYGPTTAYSGEAVLLFSEVDPALNGAVAGGTYGTAAYPTVMAMKYHPTYFLINGAPFPGSSPIAAGTAGAANPVLLRFLNAGLRTRLAVVQGDYVDLLALDGNLLPHRRTQYSVELAPGGTVDAFLAAPAAAGYVPIFERTLGAHNDGMLTYLAFAPAIPGTTFTLSVATAGNGAVATSGAPGGIACGADCSEVYPDGTVVNLAANPSPASIFAGWSGACTGLGPCGVTMTADTAVNATFVSTASRLAAFEVGTWYLDSNGSGAWDGAGFGLDTTAVFGTSAMTPVAGDWNGDGLTEVGAYENGTWYLDLNGNGVWDGPGTDRQIASFGTAAMTPVAGDWDNDGVDEIGAYENGVWYLDLNDSGVWDAGDVSYNFGTYAMKPVVGDWNGDGRDEIAAYEDGIWYVDLNGSGAWDAGDVSHYFGTSAMTPVAGDWDNDGTDEIGAYEEGIWYLDLNGSGAWDAGDVSHFYGTSAMTPLSGVWR